MKENLAEHKFRHERKDHVYAGGKALPAGSA